MVDVVDQFLSIYPEEIRAITGKLRDVARRAMPGAYEFLYYDAINYSNTNSPVERICYISPMQKHVTLGFIFGVKLEDHHHLLRGIGKRARHVKIRTIEQAKNPALKELVKAAWTHGTDSITLRKRQRKKRRRLTRQRKGLFARRNR